MAEQSFDSLLPPEIAQRAESIGIKKSQLDGVTTFMLAVLAGAFIALGAISATIVATGEMPYAIMRLLMGLTFCLGLVLVVVGGAELFTGNNLIIMAWVSRKITLQKLLRNWTIVYLGNFVGSVVTALLMYFTKQYTFHEGAIGEAVLKIAVAKVSLDFGQALALGIMCNGLVCLAVWLTYSARTTLDKIAAIIFPITAFVAAGFEHSVANMYFVPIALFIKDFDGDFVTQTGLDVSNLTWGNFLLDNLLPVTLGNIFGGAIMVGAVYWFVYLRPKHEM